MKLKIEKQYTLLQFKMNLTLLLLLLKLLVWCCLSVSAFFLSEGRYIYTYMLEMCEILSLNWSLPSLFFPSPPLYSLFRIFLNKYPPRLGSPHQTHSCNCRSHSHGNGRALLGLLFKYDKLNRGAIIRQSARSSAEVARALIIFKSAYFSNFSAHFAPSEHIARECDCQRSLSLSFYLSLSLSLYGENRGNIVVVQSSL